jgi:hypothetical protein
MHTCLLLIPLHTLVCNDCVNTQDREGEGSKADSSFSSGLLTPSNPNAAPGSPQAPGSPNLLAMLLQTSYQPLVPGACVATRELCMCFFGGGGGARKLYEK